MYLIRLVFPGLFVQRDDSGHGNSQIRRDRGTLAQLHLRRNFARYSALYGHGVDVGLSGAGETMD
jgi:hypothetical protein